MELAHASQKGAFGLELEGGGMEMIDAPMLKQVSPFYPPIETSHKIQIS